MGLRDSTTLVPKSLKRPHYVHRHEEFCLFPEDAHHVYKAVQNDQPVAPIQLEVEHAVDSSACDSQDSVEPDTNPYEAALTREVDFQLSQDPMN